MDESLPQPKLEDIKSITKRVRLSRSTIYAWVKDGRFPAQVKLGKSSRWLTSEVNDWISGRISKRCE